MGVRHRSKRLKKLSRPTRRRTFDIPDWLLFELLLRLPLKSVFACRLVSKQWLSVASDPYFIRAYASRTPSVPQPYWTILPRYAPCRSISGPRPPYRVSRLLPGRKKCRGCGGHIVVGVSDGLALYYSCKTTKSNLSYYVFYISNPITGRWFKACELNGLPSSYAPERWGFLTRIDPEFNLRSYRVVRAGPGPTPDALTFDVYYSETDAWEEFTAALPGGPAGQLEMQASGAALDGILHWAELGLGVIAFDPEADPDRQMRVIPGPRDVGRADPDRLCWCQCVEYRGELRYIGGYSGGRRYEFPSFSIWRRLGDGEWCIQHKIVSVGAGFPIKMEGLFLDPCDSDVVYYVASDDFRGRRCVFSYGLTSGRLEGRPEMLVGEDGPLSLRCPATLTWTLSLVVPPWPTRVVVNELLDWRRSRG